MSFQSPTNPNKARVSRVRIFDGIGGPEVQVLKRTNERGNDISSTIANEVQDFDLGEKGSLILRPGMRKIDETGKAYDITSIFELNIGGLLQYGLVYDGAVELIEIPEPELPDAPQPFPFDLEPQKPPRPTDFPDGWDCPPEDPADDRMPPDPSLPPDDQICPEGYTISDSPDDLTFTMSYGGPAPATQHWWFQVEGRWSKKLTAVYSKNVSWFSNSTGGVWAFTISACDARAINAVSVQINGKDSDGNWLSTGNHAGLLSLVWNDGTVSDCIINLYVSPPSILLGGADLTWFLSTGDSADTKVATVENDGGVGSILNWTGEITGISSGVTNDPITGSLAQNVSENVDIEVTPATVGAGTHSGNFHVTDPSGGDEDSPISIQVIEPTAQTYIQWDFWGATVYAAVYDPVDNWYRKRWRITKDGKLMWISEDWNTGVIKAMYYWGGSVANSSYPWEITVNGNGAASSTGTLAWHHSQTPQNWVMSPDIGP